MWLEAPLQCTVTGDAGIIAKDAGSGKGGNVAGIIAKTAGSGGGGKGGKAAVATRTWSRDSPGVIALGRRGRFGGMVLT